MEKKYTKPDFDIIEFKCEDIILASGLEEDELDLDIESDRKFYGY